MSSSRCIWMKWVGTGYLQSQSHCVEGARLLLALYANQTFDGHYSPRVHLSFWGEAHSVYIIYTAAMHVFGQQIKKIQHLEHYIGKMSIVGTMLMESKHEFSLSLYNLNIRKPIKFGVGSPCPPDLGWKEAIKQNLKRSIWDLALQPILPVWLKQSNK